jgi:hypothetical protein
MFTHSAVRIGNVEVRIWNAGAAGEVVRLGLYNFNAEGRPGTLVADFGTVDASSNGIKQIVVSPAIDIPIGWYFLAIVGQGTGVTATLGSTWGNTPALPSSSGGAASTFTSLGLSDAYVQSSITGALPATAGTNTPQVRKYIMALNVTRI